MISDRKLTREDLPFPLDRPLTGQDLLQVFPQLLGPLWSQAANAIRPSAGVVTAINAGPPKTVTITVGTEVYQARYLKAYAPAVGDAVLFVHNAALALVLGALA